MESNQVLWPYTFVRLGGVYFEISVPVRLIMQRFRQSEMHMTEAGGVLLGRHLRDGSAIIADDITTPLPGDKRARASFFRASKRHQAAIDAVWRTSDGTCTYLGEWHTHPEPFPTPSTIDWANWQRRLANDQYSEPIFFVIVGTRATFAWEGRRDGSIVALSLIER
jgi:integrative and conjugative element protein (TIGR02256 family)